MSRTRTPKTKPTPRSTSKPTARASARRSARSATTRALTRAGVAPVEQPPPILAHIQNAQRYYSDASYRAAYVHEKFSPKQIAEALRRTRGTLAAAARMLRTTPNTLRRYLALYPDLKQVADDEIELALDVCEQGLIHDAVHGDPDARRFFLLTRGRARGYIIRREVTGANGAPIHPGDTQNNVIIVGGDKAEYLEGLRQMREAARVSLRVPPVPSPESHGNGDGG